MFNVFSITFAFLAMLPSFAAMADSGSDLAQKIRAELNMTSSTLSLAGVEYRTSKKCKLEVSADPAAGAVAIILNPTFADHFAFSPAIQDEAKKNSAEVGGLVLVNGKAEASPLTNFATPDVLSAVYTVREGLGSYLEANQLTISKLNSEIRVTISRISSMDGVVGAGIQRKSCTFNLP